MVCYDVGLQECNGWGTAEAKIRFQKGTVKSQLINTEITKEENYL